MSGYGMYIGKQTVMEYKEEKEAEIERLKQLITKLADELDRFHRYSENMDLDILIDYSLVKQAREATKDE